MFPYLWEKVNDQKMDNFVTQARLASFWRVKMLITVAAKLRTIVMFNSRAFNLSDPKPYFINDCCFGDDLAKWLIEEFRSRNVVVDGDPGQEDFGWFFGFKIERAAHFFVIAYRNDDQQKGATWIGWVERNRGLLGFIFGGPERRVKKEAVELIHHALSNSPLICDVRWHFRADFEGGVEDRGASSPA